MQIPLFKNDKKQIYFDYQSTTPCDKRVVEKMLPYFFENFGNPHSRNHEYGWKAESAIEESRNIIADIINADPYEIIFTSGATEANNLALKGLAYFNKDKKNHIITCSTEHKCVIDTCRILQKDGFKITFLPVKSDGIIDLDLLASSITDQTLLVSIMTVNNEIGVIQDTEIIGKICRSKGVYFHTDAAQALGKIPIDVEKMNIDLLSISAHKVYGPKGIGALFVRKKPRVRLSPIIHGGGQERGMRSGTLPTPLCVGFGEACRLAKIEMVEESDRLKSLSNKFYKSIMNRLPEVYLNGSKDKRIPGNLNFSFAYVEGEGLMMGIKDLSVSSGSACTSSSLESSYVLKALGVSEDLAHTSIRFGFGRFTTENEVNIAIEKVIEAVNKLRSMSPLWDMVQEGIILENVNWKGH